MPKPNQLTACAASTRQGFYRGRVRMYDEKETKYGLLCKDFYFGPRTRDRSVALKAARSVIKSLKGMTVAEQREWLESNKATSL